jgi:hypothetical protein
VHATVAGLQGTSSIPGAPRRYESIVTALIRAALGIAVGIVLAGIATRALSEYGAGDRRTAHL